MKEVLLDALIDTVKISWILIVIHILIELLEYKATPKLKLNRVLKGGFSPLIGAGVGLIPQCGFSVVAANLFAKKRIPLGAMLAVFIATSDEAIPILLSSPSTAFKLIPLLIVKFIFAIAAGYAIYLIFDRRNNVSPRVNDTIAAQPHDGLNLVDGKYGKDNDIHDESDGVMECNDIHGDGHIHNDKDNAHESGDETVKGCHGHTIGKADNKKDLIDRFIFHPLLHTLTILIYILIVNVAFGVIIYYVGEEKLTAFLNGTKYAQPFLAALVGLIPNCASSVAIAQFYALGGLSLGSAVAGLSVNAGLGIAVLFKQNKSIKQNVAIMLGLYAASAVVGLIITLIVGLV